MYPPASAIRSSPGTHPWAHQLIRQWVTSSRCERAANWRKSHANSPRRAAIMIREPKNQSKADLAQFSMMEQVFESSAGTLAEKIDGFPKFASRQALAKFVARYEIFKHIL